MENTSVPYSGDSAGKAEWGTKQALLKRYEGLNIYTLNRWLSEMRNDATFRQGVINPTHKIWPRIKSVQVK